MACWVDWAEGSDTVIITWLPRGLSWSSSNYWWESGSRSWWIIRDELVFAMKLYQLPGKCFYKSDELGGFEDPDPDSFLPTGTKKFKRWFQFRHWVIYWYAEAQWGWNYQWTETPPKNPDGSSFSLDSVLSLPSMPNVTLPTIRLPSLPGMPSMPSMPSLPSLSMPSLSAPSLSMPSLSAPSLSMPSLPEKKKRPTGKWDCHGMIELEGMKACAKGSKLVLSNATVVHFWEDKNGYVDTERKEHQRLVLECSDNEQAQSWVLSLKESGVEEGEIGGCCTVA